MEFTAEYLANALGADRHASRLIVAFSGGTDSTVLLHALSTLAQRDDAMHVVAVHIDHGLHTDSPEWASHCERIASESGIAFSAHRVDVDATGAGIEAAARDARYGRLRDLVANGDCLITAHHQDDQFETVLLQLMRGAGPPGLAAMPARARFGRGWHIRPLLNVPRSAMRAYAKRNGLPAVEDPANADLRFDRVYMRQQITPLLEERWPAAARSAARSAAHCASATGLLEQLAAQDLGESQAFELASFEGLSRDRVINALRYWIRRLGLPAPSTQQVNAIYEELIPAADDATPRVAWPGAEIRRYRNRLYALAPLPKAGPGISIEASFDRPFVFDLPGPNGQIWFVPHSGSGLSLDALRGETLNLRYRTGGERIRPAGGAHSRELKTLFQEQGIFPWARERIPLVYAGAELVAVADIWVADRFAAIAGEAALRVRWETKTRVC